MGFLRVVRGLFTASSQVAEHRGPLADAIVSLHSRVATLEERLEATQVEFRRFRGRVYAWKGHEIAPETPAEPGELPLTDPRVSKAELRSRLLKPGKPFKHN